MKLFLTAFFMAWGMFWIVPCPVLWWDERARRGMLLFLPAIGLLIGAVWAGLGFALGALRAPRSVFAGVMAVCPFILPGFIHLDGYMDCADAILSRRDLETRRKILKDSHVGSFAVIALGILFLLQFAFLLSGEGLSRALWCLPFVCAVPRAVSILFVLTARPLPGSSYEKMFSDGVPARQRLCAAAELTALAALPPLLLGVSGWCALMGGLGAALTILFARRDLGGMSGDVSGAGITVGELCGLAALIMFTQGG